MTSQRNLAISSWKEWLIYKPFCRCVKIIWLFSKWWRTYMFLPQTYRDLRIEYHSTDIKNRSLWSVFRNIIKLLFSNSQRWLFLFSCCFYSAEVVPLVVRRWQGAQCLTIHSSFSELIVLSKIDFFLQTLPEQFCIYWLPTFPYFLSKHNQICVPC